MFVQKNTGKDIKAYFLTQLNTLYSSTEINILLKQLVCHRMQWEHGVFLSNFAVSSFSESDLLYFNKSIKRLLDKEPIQYIVGETYFYNLPIKCVQNVLIPRPETEELVQWIVDSSNFSEKLIIHDLCTGSGCIGLALKKQNNKHVVFLSDVSEFAVKLSNENEKLNNLDVSILNIDITDKEAFNSFTINSFDIWVSNPPYIPYLEKKNVDDNVLKHEPELALFVGNEDPLVFYKKIAEQGLLYLKRDGYLFFEINPNYLDDLVFYLEKNGYKNVQLNKDIHQKNRMIKAQKL